MQEKEILKQAVRERYSAIATGKASSCCGPDCCTDESIVSTDADRLGYSSNEVSSVPQESNLGLGCGNPQAIAALKEGETVLDLGSGAGFDCFLAARQVGETGRVIGVDMTSEMIRKARENAEKNNFTNVEFRLGEIEHLPVADKTVDVIISNCVINLSPEKEKVFKEAYRVLKPNGRLAIADVVLTAELPNEIKNDLSFYSSCVSGAAYVVDLERMLRDAGFVQIRIQPKDESKEFVREWAVGTHIENYVVSATIEAVKPV